MTGALLWFGVVVTGAAGAVLRFVVDRAVSARTGGTFPWGTLLINVTGSFALGVLAAAVRPGPALLLAGTAGLGSYTTFSTWMFESNRLAEAGESALLALNLFVGMAAGLVAATLGWLLGGWL